MDGIKFERAQSHFLATFSLPSSSSLLKVPIIQFFREFRTFFFVLNIASLSQSTFQRNTRLEYNFLFLPNHSRNAVKTRKRRESTTFKHHFQGTLSQFGTLGNEKE